MNFKPIMATINPNLQEAAHDSTVSFLSIFFPLFLTTVGLGTFYDTTSLQK